MEANEHRRRLGRAIGALAAACLAVAACGGGDNEPSTDGCLGTGVLHSIANVGPGEAWAVGWRCADGVKVPLARHWTGDRWRTTDVPVPPGGDSELTSVSGTLPDSVWAVGTTTGGPTGDQPVVVRWDGSRWTIWATPDAVSLQDVGAVGADVVWVAGSAEEQVPRYRKEGPEASSYPFAGRWISQLWRRSSVKPQGEANGAHAIGVGPGDDVWVAGSQAVAGADEPSPWVELRRDHWRVLEVPGGSAEGDVLDIDMRTQDDVWLVGRLDARPMVLHWDGETLEAAPLPDRVPDGSLTGVSVDARDVWAVGSTDDGEALAIHWNGKAWSRVPVEGASALRDVAVFPDGTVLAVGGDGTRPDPVVVTLAD
jgi:hypothetical protein